MFKSRSGLPHVPVRARLELGCTRPSQAIMAAWLIALEARARPTGVELVSSSTTSSGLRTLSFMTKSCWDIPIGNTLIKHSQVDQ